MYICLNKISNQIESMKVEGQHFRTAWMEGSTVFLIEQNALPFEFRIFEAAKHLETCRAISEMIVRGAGAIGATAGYAMAQAFLEAPENGLKEYVDAARTSIETTRPTAQNLFYATGRVYKAAFESPDPISAAVSESQAIADEDAESCRLIGIHGQELIRDGAQIETHCNAGWLAFVDYGSALAPIYEARRNGKDLKVLVDETRPRSQGARLTAWELKNEQVPHVIIPDNAGAHLMSLGKIDMVIVGSDRIARNGDVANKIGTLEKAIAAKEFGVPFYVAAPSSTIDLDCRSGKDIPIEERSQDEILYQTGKAPDGSLHQLLVCSPGSEALNPAFDVTPSRYISGIITEKGIIQASEEGIRGLFSQPAKK